jgi:hypothetical protein
MEKKRIHINSPNFLARKREFSLGLFHAGFVADEMAMGQNFL